MGISKYFCVHTNCKYRRYILFVSRFNKFFRFSKIFSGQNIGYCWKQLMCRSLSLTDERLEFIFVFVSLFVKKAFRSCCFWHCGGIFSEKITHFAIAFRLHGNQFLTGLHERKQKLIIRLWRGLQLLVGQVLFQQSLILTFKVFYVTKICIWKMKVCFIIWAVIYVFQLFKTFN